MAEGEWESGVDVALFAIGTTFPPSAIDALTPGEHCDMPSLFGRLKSRPARTIAYPMYEPWLDVGREEDLRRANSHP